MIEVYSENIDVATNESIALNVVKLLKGCSVNQQGASSLIFNKCGIYEVKVDAYATATGAGDISVQMRQNGVLQPAAQSAVTAADATSVNPMSFTTLVQVPVNNSNCPCNIPTTIDFVNTGVNANYYFHVVVTKI
jgi:hypothetical protein